ncbi:hypothetical protein PAXRUDRAFT_16116 [Paxillus rubicundulus Ve08.2h10]|uniref:Uncharacterized protein n=1 Tax=Paxillus rubicundulus Ve08.2h10 TaxID=930991 RepID=A0A0D0D801_9AGAM|nr:hypothetical protein PAXRUDRAFT_16116 [Paxillus rubicundulus Ve08.2h10]
MLVDLKAMLLKKDTDEEATQLQALKETLDSKDFETALNTWLLACVRSPNLTAYVTDASMCIVVYNFPKVKHQLNICLDQLKDGTDSDNTEQSAGTTASGDGDDGPGDTEQPASTGGLLDEGEQDKIEEPTSAKNKPDELGEADSGLRLDGKPIHWTDKMFWNYVDYMLNVLHGTAHEHATSQEDYETNVCIIMIQIFQDDLKDCLGKRMGSKLLNVMHLQWQMTIQQGLIW